MNKEDVAQIEKQTQFLTSRINSLRDTQGAGILLKEMVEIENNLVQYISDAQKNKLAAEEKLAEAKGYHVRLTKLGSGAKKVRLLTEAQEAMLVSMNSMQQVEAIMFKFQQILVTFTQKCMYICVKNERNLNDFANILWEYRKNKTTPQEVRATVEEIYNEIVERKKIFTNKRWKKGFRIEKYK